MSQNNIEEILFRLDELERKMKEYEECKKEFEDLKSKVEDITRLDFAPIHDHMRKWDNRDLYLFRTKMFLKRYIYSPIHLGVKTTFFIAGKLILTLATGIVAGILLNIIGIGTLFNTIIDFFSNIFN